MFKYLCRRTSCLASKNPNLVCNLHQIAFPKYGRERSSLLCIEFNNGAVRSNNDAMGTMTQCDRMIAPCDGGDGGDGDDDAMLCTMTRCDRTMLWAVSRHIAPSLHRVIASFALLKSANNSDGPFRLSQVRGLSMFAHGLHTKHNND